MVTKDSEPDILSPDCPLRQTLGLISDPWLPQIIYLLSFGTKRYNEFQKKIPGISHKTLTQSLRSLELNGVVHRKVYAVVPPKVEYSLTNFGKKLVAPIKVIVVWSEMHTKELADAARYRQERLELDVENKSKK
jgi:DNA-binding HxlR family transcriptional regulator